MGANAFVGTSADYEMYWVDLKIAGKLLPPGSYRVHVDGLTSTGTVEDFNDYLIKVTAR